MRQPPIPWRFRASLTASSLLLALMAAPGLERTAQAQDATAAAPMVESPTWEDIAGDILEDTSVQDGQALFEVDAPYRAEDASTVPVVIRQLDPSRRITGLKLVVDENPSPLVAHFQFGPAVLPLKLETRIRVNQYSNLRVLAETEDGIFMHGRYIKASGGCSAPATRDPAAALQGAGAMKLRVFDANPADPLAGGRREAQIMIRHPNYSGLQMNQLTQLYIPALFINELTVHQGDELLLSLEGGISISENPVFRFAYLDNGSPSFRVHAVDTDGNVFDEVLSKSRE